MADHFGDKLVKKIRNTKSFLCLGVDPHLDLIPNIFKIFLQLFIKFFIVNCFEVRVVITI